MRRAVGARGLVVSVAILMVAGCGTPAVSRTAEAVPKPPAVVADAFDGPLADGEESIYGLVNSGDLATANEMLGNVWRLPRFAPVTLPARLTWHEDPYQASYWRFVFYSLRPTSNLLWAYRKTGDRRYRDKLLDVLRQFTAYDATNPPLDRFRLDNQHAAAFRTMVLVNCYVKLSASHDLPADLAAAVRRSIAKLAAFLTLPVNYQGTYNHGFTEAAALLLVPTNFPELPGAAAWRALAETRLSSLINQTVDADGVEVEKSPFYHFYVLNFLLQLEDWAAQNRVTLPPSFRDRINTMIRYSTDIIWPDGTIPLLGSSVRLKPSGEDALYAQVERAHPEFGYAVSAGAHGSPPTERAALFPQSGQAILRADPHSGAEYRDNSQLVLDVGRTHTAHSHLDALAFSYYSQGRVLLPDSGLYTYSRGPAYTFFHGTSAHNTVVVDGKDQGPGPVTAGLTATGPDWTYQSGAHGLYAGVRHQRSVLMLGHDLVLVADTLTGAGPHSFNQLWHFFPGAHVVTDGMTTTAFDEQDRPAVRIVQASLGAPTTTVGYYGAQHPMQGWYSEQYGHTQPNHVVGYVQNGTQASYLTLIASGRYAAGTAAITAASVTGAGLSAQVCADGFSTHVAIAHQAGPGEAVRVTDGTAGVPCSAK